MIHVLLLNLFFPLVAYRLQNNEIFFIKKRCSTRLANNLQIFSAGAEETARKVEDYAAEIEVALKAANIVDPSECQANERHGHWRTS